MFYCLGFCFYWNIIPQIHVPAADVFDVLKAHILVDGFHLVMDLDKSKGSWIVDARDGRRYLDFYTFFATTPLGHNHPGLCNPEFLAKLGAVAVNKTANSDIYTTAYAEWVKTFGDLAAPSFLSKLFWIDRYTQVLVYTTQCNTSPAKFRPSAPEWLHQWLLFCWLPELKENVSH